MKLIETCKEGFGFFLSVVLLLSLPIMENKETNNITFYYLRD